MCCEAGLPKMSGSLRRLNCAIDGLSVVFQVLEFCGERFPVAWIDHILCQGIDERAHAQGTLCARRRTGC
jgi:hypothetical protein